MRYLAQRVKTGEWLSRDLPLTEVERVRELSGGGSITATVPPGARSVFHTDGLRILEDWGTILYACDDTDGKIRQCGIVQPPQDHDGEVNKITTGGFASYPQGYIRTESLPAQIQVNPISMFMEHWNWIQSQADSDLGIVVYPPSYARGEPDPIGDNENPYRQEWFEAPDLGAAMDDLASNTPFDYVEGHRWADAAQRVPEHFIRIGWPRIGHDRTDLRFALGENIIDTIPAQTSEEFANDVIGIGNGEGATLVYGRATRTDGRLRRTRVVTDKTVIDRKVMLQRTAATLERLAPTLDMTTIAIKDHRNARISDINLGDDIVVETHLRTSDRPAVPPPTPTNTYGEGIYGDLHYGGSQAAPDSYGDITLKVRVLSIGESDDLPGIALLGVQRSNAFNYNPLETLS